MGLIELTKKSSPPHNEDKPNVVLVDSITLSKDTYGILSPELVDVMGFSGNCYDPTTGTHYYSLSNGSLYKPYPVLTNLLQMKTLTRQIKNGNAIATASGWRRMPRTNNGKGPKILVKIIGTEKMKWFEVHNEEQIRNDLAKYLEYSGIVAKGQDLPENLLWIIDHKEFSFEIDRTINPDFVNLGEIAEFVRSHDDSIMPVLAQCRILTIAEKRNDSYLGKVFDWDELVEIGEDSNKSVFFDKDGTTHIFNGAWRDVNLIVKEDSDAMEFFPSKECLWETPSPTHIHFTPDETVWTVLPSYRDVADKTDTTPIPTIEVMTSSGRTPIVVENTKQLRDKLGNVEPPITMLNCSDFGLNLRYQTLDIDWLVRAANFIRTYGIVGEAAFKFCGNLNTANQMLKHYIMPDEGEDILLSADKWSKEKEGYFTALLARNNEPLLFRGIWKRERMTIEKKMLTDTDPC